MASRFAVENNIYKIFLIFYKLDSYFLALISIRLIGILPDAGAVRVDRGGCSNKTKTIQCDVCTYVLVCQGSVGNISMSFQVHSFSFHICNNIFYCIIVCLLFLAKLSLKS